MAEVWPDSTRQVFRPRAATAKLAALSCAALLLMSAATSSRGPLTVAVVPFLFFVQCFQHVEVAGNRARRTGLRAVDLDLTTAHVKTTGRSWWMQLFFLGRCLELRDADGRGLLLEGWLWSAATQQALVDALEAANPSAAAPHS